MMFYKLSRNSYLKIKPNEIMISIVVDSNRFNLVINEEAYDIYKYCNGKNTIEMIIDKLKVKYTNPEKYVLDFVEKNIEKHIIETSEIRKEDLIERGSKSIYYPDVVVWEITNVCPLNCKHCYLGTKHNSYITRQQIEQILLIFKEKGISTVQLTGGEVFTHPDIVYIVERLNELDIRISISTSGYIYNELVENVLNILRSNASIRISLDGTEDYHNNIRGKADAYIRTIEFIKKARAKGIAVQLGSVIINQNDKMIHEMIHIAKSIGVSVHSFSVVLDEGNAIKNKKCSRLSNQLLQEKLKEWSKQYDCEDYIIQTSVKDTETNCGCGYKLIRIRPDLTITPCPMIEGTIGDLKKESFDSIMKKGTDYFMNIELPTRNKKHCENCEKKDDCGECVAMALINNKKVEGKCRWAKGNTEIVELI